MPLRVGDCFWRQFPGDHDPRLWIIVTSPCLGYEHDTVTVSVTSKKSTSDLTCCLRVGDHPGLTKDSVISYYHSALRPSSQIETAVGSLDFSFNFHRDSPDFDVLQGWVKQAVEFKERASKTVEAITSQL